MTPGRERRRFVFPSHRAWGTGPERFGFAVKDRREALGLTQEEFAERAGIRCIYLSDIERAAQDLSMRISELFRLAE